MYISDYQVVYFEDFDFNKIDTDENKWVRKSNAGHPVFAYEDIITVDTETTDILISASEQIAFVNAWSITIENKVCLYGRHIQDLILTIEKICRKICGDKNHLIKFFIHNFSYDYTYMRNHMFKRWGQPMENSVLAVKTHKYIFMRWDDMGLEFRDSAILTQRTLEKLCKDMGTLEKATGKWDYNRKILPNTSLSEDDLRYLNTDTISLCKALRIYIKNRHCNTATVPLTNTGFIRNNARARSRKDKTYRKLFLSMQNDYETYKQLTDCFHGGYTHANRYYINETITEKMTCYDFASSYPSVMCYEKYPMSGFQKVDVTLSDILELKDDYAFCGYLFLRDVHCKKDHPMPSMSISKAKRYYYYEKENYTDKINRQSHIDNGKIVHMEEVIYPFTDADLEYILESYDYSEIGVVNVRQARKDYLPKWFTDYIMELFYNKCTLKGVDPVNYMISKGELNGMYGMTVQKSIQDLSVEDYGTGMWSTIIYEGEEAEEKLAKFNKSRNSFLPFQWGVWVTAYAQRNLFRLGNCCEKWIYSDTDSVKGYKWNKEKLDKYNNDIILKSKKRKIGSVIYNDKKYVLGIAEYDGTYTEFKTLGAKKYIYKEDGKLHMTLAGVPKYGVYCLNNDIDNFDIGFVFSNNDTFKRNFKKANPDKEIKWKLRPNYILEEEVKTITINDCRIEYGCSAILVECDYQLDTTIKYDKETGLPLNIEVERDLYDVY